MEDDDFYRQIDLLTLLLLDRGVDVPCGVNGTPEGTVGGWVISMAVSIGTPSVTRDDVASELMLMLLSLDSFPGTLNRIEFKLMGRMRHMRGILNTVDIDDGPGVTEQDVAHVMECLNDDEFFLADMILIRGLKQEEAASILGKTRQFVAKRMRAITFKINRHVRGM